LVDAILAHLADLTGGDPIGQIFTNAWNRLKRKQLLFLYPFAVGVMNVLAFLAVYISLGGALTWDAFSSADYSRWDFIQRHFQQILSPGLALAVALVVGVLICLVLAMIRAPFFRAVAGVGYPLAARSWTTVAKLWLFYLLSYAVLFVVPSAFAPGSTAFTVASYAMIPVAVVIIFADYAVVFEDLWPLAAVRRSLQLVRHGWLVVLLVYAASLVIWSLVASVYGNYYDASHQIFFLLPLSQLLVEAIITTIVDVVLIFAYDSLRGH
jgi:hypothetical protein